MVRIEERYELKVSEFTKIRYKIEYEDAFKQMCERIGRERWKKSGVGLKRWERKSVGQEELEREREDYK